MRRGEGMDGVSPIGEELWVRGVCGEGGVVGEWGGCGCCAMLVLVLMLCVGWQEMHIHPGGIGLFCMIPEHRLV